ncbi:MAG: transposase [Microscillaceae bacterium]|jgi:transposase|nr:transposase [Microscillaceae bacterium]
MTKKEYPSWVLSHKSKGTEIREMGGRYYLYQVSAFWDKDKKKSRKKTGCLLGRITEQGLVLSKARLHADRVGKISILESGMSEYIYAENADILSALTKYFPTDGKTLFLLSLFRLAYQSPLKNMAFYYEHSFMREVLSGVKLGKNDLTTLLKAVGNQRATISACMKSLMGNPSYVLIDQTHIISLSEQMDCNRLGYNSQRVFEPQVNLLSIFSPVHKIPLYYRMLAGDIRETKALKLTVEASGLQEAIVIGDKGFYSQTNVANLTAEGLDYILPIRRSHTLCDYTCISTSDKQSFDGYFFFEERIIWYKAYQKEAHQLILFLDTRLKEQEQKDYLLRIKKDPNPESQAPLIEKNKPDILGIETETKEVTELETIAQGEKKPHTLAKFYDRQHLMGTITLEYSLKKMKTPEEIFNYFKSRNEIENTYDAYKNILEADATYMQGQTQMETWSFINFLALIMYFRIYKKLLDKDLLKKFAPKDILLFLEHIKKLKINDQWVQAEITQKSQKILDLLRI